MSTFLDYVRVNKLETLIRNGEIKVEREVAQARLEHRSEDQRSIDVAMREWGEKTNENSDVGTRRELIGSSFLKQNTASGDNATNKETSEDRNDAHFLPWYHVFTEKRKVSLREQNTVAEIVEPGPFWQVELPTSVTWQEDQSSIQYAEFDISNVRAAVDIVFYRALDIEEDLAYSKRFVKKQKKRIAKRLSKRIVSSAITAAVASMRRSSQMNNSSKKREREDASASSPYRVRRSRRLSEMRARAELWNEEDDSDEEEESMRIYSSDSDDGRCHHMCCHHHGGAFSESSSETFDSDDFAPEDTAEAPGILPYAGVRSFSPSSLPVEATAAAWANRVEESLRLMELKPMLEGEGEEGDRSDMPLIVTNGVCMESVFKAQENISLCRYLRGIPDSLPHTQTYNKVGDSYDSIENVREPMMGGGAMVSNSEESYNESEDSAAPTPTRGSTLGEDDNSSSNVSSYDEYEDSFDGSDDEDHATLDQLAAPALRFQLSPSMVPHATTSGEEEWEYDDHTDSDIVPGPRRRTLQMFLIEPPSYFERHGTEYQLPWRNRRSAAEARPLGQETRGDGIWPFGEREEKRRILGVARCKDEVQILVNGIVIIRQRTVSASPFISHIRIAIPTLSFTGSILSPSSLSQAQYNVSLFHMLDTIFLLSSASLKIIFPVFLSTHDWFLFSFFIFKHRNRFHSRWV